tara:strand:+ start:238 stop:525 length:288 start_codon:yes stop_codon:yes gene_type:complete
MLLEKLPQEIKEMALEEKMEQIEKGLIKGTTAKKLINSFLWKPSKMGYEFWKSINESKQPNMKPIEQVLKEWEDKYNQDCLSLGYPELMIKEETN